MDRIRRDHILQEEKTDPTTDMNRTLSRDNDAVENPIFKQTRELFQVDKKS
jgi:hypothetical protein